MALNLDKYYAEKNRSNVTIKINNLTINDPKPQDKFKAIQVEPTFTYVLIDESGSMYSYIDNVIEGYKVMIDTLRESASTIAGAHFITLVSFNEEYKIIQEGARLNPVQGQDNIKMLSKDNYNPCNRTFLYDCLYEALNSMLETIHNMQDQGLRPKLNIALISDGEDYTSVRSPEPLRDLILQMRAEEFLNSSVVLGLLDDDFTADKLENIRKTIGFEKAISLDKSNAKGIRRAFREASRQM